MRGRNALAGRMGLWSRQFSDTGERTLPAILDTLRDYGGYDLLCQKCADGVTWQGRIDPLTPLRSPADVLAMQTACEARGVAFCPVVVPRHPAVASPHAQAAMHAEIARAAGVLMVDLEPYEGFWQYEHHRIPEYTAELRRLAPAAYLVNQPDPRSFGRRDAYVDQTAHQFDALCAQHYVGWAGVGWTDVESEVRSFDSLATLGREMYVTLYGVERTDLAGQFWERVRLRVLGGHVFALGPMNGNQLRFFGALTRATPPKPEPPLPPVEVVDAAMRLRADVAGHALLGDFVRVHEITGQLLTELRYEQATRPLFALSADRSEPTRHAAADGGARFRGTGGNGGGVTD